MSRDHTYVPLLESILQGFPGGHEVKLSRTRLPNQKSQDKDKTKRYQNPKKHIGTSITKMRPQIPKELLPVARVDVEECSFQTYLCVFIVVNDITQLTNHLRLIFLNSFSHSP